MCYSLVITCAERYNTNSESASVVGSRGCVCPLFPPLWVRTLLSARPAEARPNPSTSSAHPGIVSREIGWERWDGCPLWHWREIRTVCRGREASWFQPPRINRVTPLRDYGPKFFFPFFHSPVQPNWNSGMGYRFKLLLNTLTQSPQTAWEENFSNYLQRNTKKTEIRAGELDGNKNWK